MQQDEKFAERLRRIEERKAAQRNVQTGPIRSKGKGAGGGGFAGTLILFAGVLVLGGVGVFITMDKDSIASLQASVAGFKETFEAPVLEFENTLVSANPLNLDNMMENAMERQQEQNEADWAAAAIARDENLVAPPKPPTPVATEPRTTDRMGVIYGSGYAAANLGLAVPVAEVFAGFEPTGPNTPHGDIRAFEPVSACELRPVGPDEKLVNVNIQSANQTGPIQRVFSDGIDIQIEDAITDAMEKGRSFGMMNIYRGEMGVVDVLVTDTSGPLYLALQTMSSNRIWNIHAAPGVEIAHIAMISGGASALTGNIGDASFEAMRAADFDIPTDFYSFRGEVTDLDCMSRPFRQPNESWGAWEGAKGGNTLDGNLLFGQDKGFDAYNHWFTNTFGVDANTRLISAMQAGAVLIGRRPAEPLPAVGGETPVHIVSADIILAGSADKRETELVSLYEERVAAAAGGAYQDILPDAVEMSAVLDAAPTESEIGGADRSFGDFVFNANDVESKVSLTELNRHREVVLTQPITIADVLQPGEDVPPEDLHEAYILMRAPRAMMPYCTDTVAELGTKCAILSTRLSGGRDGLYSIRTDFAYTPNYSIGDVVRVKGSEFVSASVDEDEAQSYQTPEERRAFLARLKTICDDLRAEFGNCLVGSARFSLHQQPTNLPSRLNAPKADSAFGTVEVYLPDNRFEQRNFQERVEELLAEK